MRPPTPRRHPRPATDGCPPMIVNQWVPAAHRGDAIGDSARRVLHLLRGMGHQSDIFAMTIDDDLRDEVRPFTDPEARRGDLTIFHFALVSAMTRGVCQPAPRTRAAVPQRHAGAFLRALRTGHLPARDAQPRGPADAGRPHRRRPRRFGVQPPGTRVDGVHQHRRLPHRHRHPTHHARRSPPRPRCGAGRRPAQLPVRRPHRAEQEDRRPHPAGGVLQALRRRALPLHLRRPDRRACRATTTPSGR